MESYLLSSIYAIMAHTKGIEHVQWSALNTVLILMGWEDCDDLCMNILQLSYPFRTTLARWRAAHLEDKTKEQVNLI